MADVNANINIDINASAALAQLKALETQISNFNNSIARSNVAASRAQKDFNDALRAQIDATGYFNTSLRTMEGSISSLGTAFDKGTLSAKQYFRYAASQMPGLANAFRGLGKEQAEMAALAENRVKQLQTRYVSLGKDINGMQKMLAIQPKTLAAGYATDIALAEQRQQLFNRALQLGSTGMVNWGKNTQWAGRQLMVGFTVPMTIAAGAAAKFFMDLDKSGVAFKRVYGDLNTTTQEAEKNLKAVQALGIEYTKYGLAVNEVIDIGARAAATGAQNEDLLAATEQTIRLATLGQTDYQTALDATISLQTAFGISSANLATTIDFLNAVENQTVLTLEDVARAVPRVAPVIKGLGGDVQDLAVFMTALREGGVSAEQGANALKSGLASLINPTDRATETLKEMGINIKAIVDANRGDLMGTVRAFGQALESVSEFERQQALEATFGKYQYARLGALFKNIARDGSQAARAMELAGMSVKDLASLSEQELSILSESVTNKFLGAVERLKVAIAPIGEMFLKVATPIIEVVTNIANKFNELPDTVKTVIAGVVGAVGLIAPAVLMGIGLIANGIGNGLKFILALRGGIKGLVAALTGSSRNFQYQTTAALDAAAAMSTLDGRTDALTGSLLMQEGAVRALSSAYGGLAAAASGAAASMPTAFPGLPVVRRGVPVVRRAKGGAIPGTGNTDSVPALLTPGEFVMTKEATEQFGPVLAAMNAGSVKGFAEGGGVSQSENVRAAALEFSHVAEKFELTDDQIRRLITELEEVGQTGSKAYRELTRVMNEAPQREAAGGQRERVYGYSNVGIPLRGDVNRGLGAEGVARGDVSSAIRQSGAGSAAGIIDLLAQRGVVLDPDTERRFADTFYTAFSDGIDQLPDEIVRDANMTDPFRNAVRQAAQELGDDVGRVATSIIDEEMATASTIVTETGQAHGGTGRAPIKKGTGNVRATSYTSRRSKIAGVFRRLMGGRSMQEVATEGVAVGAATASPSDATRQTGQDIDSGLVEGMQQGEPEVRSQGERVGKAAVESVQDGADSSQLSLFDETLAPNLPQQEQLDLFDPNSLANTNLEASQNRVINANNEQAAAKEKLTQAELNLANANDENVENNRRLRELVDKKAEMEAARLGNTQEYTDLNAELGQRYSEAMSFNEKQAKLTDEVNVAKERLAQSEIELANANKEAATLQEQNNAATKQNTEATQKDTNETTQAANAENAQEQAARKNAQNTQADSAKTQAGAPIVGPGGAGLADELEDTTKQTRTMKDRIRGVSGKLFGVSAAFTGLTVAGSFMEGQIGQVAQSLMPLSFGLDAVTGLLPMMMSPMGIVIGAAAALGGGLWFLNQKSNELSEKAEVLADSMKVSSDTIRQTADLFGNQLLVDQQKVLDFTKATGTTSKQLAQGLEFLESEVGKTVLNGFVAGADQFGTDAALQNLANNLASMVLQGAITPKQAESIAAGLEQQLGVEGLAIQIKGRLESLIGPDGKDVLTNPISVAVKLQAETQEVSKTTQEALGKSIQTSMEQYQNEITTMTDRYFNNLALQDIPVLSGIARNFMSFFDPQIESTIGQLRSYGQLVGNEIAAAYDNLDAAVERYKQRLAEAREIEDPEKRKRILNGLKFEKQQIDAIKESILDANESTIKWFQGLESGFQAEFLGSLEQSIRDRFADTAFQPVVDGLISQLSKLENKTIALNLQFALASGQINPMLMQQIFSLFGEDTTSASAVMNLVINREGYSAANDFFMNLFAIGDETVTKTLLTRYEEEDPQRTKEGFARETAEITLDLVFNRRQMDSKKKEIEEYIDGIGLKYKDENGIIDRALLGEDRPEVLAGLVALENELDLLDRKAAELVSKRDGLKETFGSITDQANATQLAALGAEFAKIVSIMGENAPKIDVANLKESAEDVQNVTNTFAALAEAPPEVVKKLKLESYGFDGVAKLSSYYDDFISKDPQVVKQAILAAQGDIDMLKSMGMTLDEFMAKPNVFRIAALATVQVAANVEIDLKIAENYAAGLVSGASADRVEYATNRVNELRDQLSNFKNALGNLKNVFGGAGGGGGGSTPTSTGGGGGGGGGGGESKKTGADLVKEYLQELEQQKKFLGDISKKNGEIAAGFAQALRAAGAPEQLIADIVAKGEDGLKMAKELLKDKAKKLKEVSNLMLEVTRLTFVESQRAEAANLAAQASSQMALANSGISPDIIANMDSQQAQAVAAAYAAYQQAQRRANAAKDKSTKKQKEANQELAKARKEWEMVTSAINKNTNAQIKNNIAQLVLARKTAENKTSAALTLAGKGFSGEQIVDIFENSPEAANRIVAYTNKIKQLSDEREKLKKKIDNDTATKEEQRRYDALGKQLTKVRGDYNALIRTLQRLSKEQTKTDIANTILGMGVRTVGATRQGKAQDILMGGGYTYDQASSIAGDEETARAIVGADRQVNRAGANLSAAQKAQADYLAKGGKKSGKEWERLKEAIAQARRELAAAKKDQDDLNASIEGTVTAETALEWKSVVGGINSEIAKQANNQKFINLGIKDGLVLNRLNSLTLEQQNYFLTLSAEQQKAFVDSLAASIPLSEKIADAFERIADAQRLQTLRNEEATNKYMGKTLEQYDDQLELLDDQLDVQNDLLRIQQDKVDVLQEENDDLNRGLELLSRQEEKINEAFDKRIEALDKVEQANARIAQQQQNQLNLAQSLAEGDIYAATQAAQQIKQDNATAAIENTREALETAREEQLKNLVVEVNGQLLTRDQIEKEILSNNDQIYQIQEDQIEPIQKVITSINDQISAVNRLKEQWQDYYKSLEDNAVDPITGLKYKDLSRLKEFYDAIFNAQTAAEKDARKALEQAMKETGLTIDSATFFTKFGINPGAPAPTQPGTTQPGGATTADVNAGKEAAIAALPEVVKVKEAAEAIKKTITETPAEIDKFTRSVVDNAQPAIDNAKTSAQRILTKFKNLGKFLIDELIPNSLTPFKDFVAGDLLTAVNNIVAAFMNVNGQIVGAIVNVGNLANSLNNLQKEIRINIVVNTTYTSSGGGNEPGKQKKFAGGLIKMATGGMIPGGIPRDSVPILASPGEFVVRNAMVDKYGMSMLNDINQGSFQPTFRTPSGTTYTKINKPTEINTNRTMYNNNYSINVTANTNANADEIASATVMKIRQMNSMQIRGARG